MAIAYGKEGAPHNPENSRLLGVFQFQISPTRVQQIAPSIDVQFLSKSPRKDALAIANHKEIFILESLSDPGSLGRIFSLEPNKGFLLSIAWAPDDRLYFTVDDSVQLDDRHYSAGPGSAR